MQDAGVAMPGAASCSRCGGALAAGARFCGRCGAPVAAAPAPRFCSFCGAPWSPSQRACPACGHAPVEPSDGSLRPAPAGTARSPGFAQIVRRWVAFSIIDGILAFLLAFLVGAAVELALTPFFAEELEADAPLVRGFLGVTVLAVYAAYYWWGNATGRSLGKRALGLRAVRATDQSPPGWGRGLVRTAGYILSALPFWLGFLWAIWDARQQTWHDRLAGTIVVADG